MTTERLCSPRRRSCVWAPWLDTDRGLKIMTIIKYERVSVPLVDNAWLIMVE
jgi:hypothetical protein